MLSGKKAYICSPLSAPDAKGVSHNMDMARFYIYRQVPFLTPAFESRSARCLFR